MEDEELIKVMKLLGYFRLDDYYGDDYYDYYEYYDYYCLDCYNLYYFHSYDYYYYYFNLTILTHP